MTIVQPHIFPWQPNLYSVRKAPRAPCEIWVNSEEDRIALSRGILDLTLEKTQELPAPIREAVARVLGRYGGMSQSALVQSVYSRYPWFAVKSELPERRFASVQCPPTPSTAVYTAGYEGKSVDAFLNDLLRRGIEVVVDVRANPISRKYGFAGSRLSEICRKLGLDYRHVPSLGIPSSSRSGLSGFASYQRLMNQYEQLILPERSSQVAEVGRLMQQQPSVLVCLEKDVRCCHRSRLAKAVAETTGLEVMHL